MSIKGLLLEIVVASRTAELKDSNYQNRHRMGRPKPKIEINRLNLLFSLI